MCILGGVFRAVMGPQNRFYLGLLEYWKDIKKISCDKDIVMGLFVSFYLCTSLYTDTIYFILSDSTNIYLTESPSSLPNGPGKPYYVFTWTDMFYDVYWKCNLRNAVLIIYAIFLPSPKFTSEWIENKLYRCSFMVIMVNLVFLQVW